MSDDFDAQIDHEIWVIWRFCSIIAGGCLLVFGTLGVLLSVFVGPHAERTTP